MQKSIGKSAEMSSIDDMAFVHSTRGGCEHTLNQEICSLRTLQENSKPTLARRLDPRVFSVWLLLKIATHPLQSFLDGDGGIVRSLEWPMHHSRVLGGTWAETRDEDDSNQDYRQIALTSMSMLDGITLLAALPTLLKNKAFDINAAFAIAIGCHDALSINLRWLYGSSFATRKAIVVQELLDHGLDPIADVSDSMNTLHDIDYTTDSDGIITVLSSAICEGHVEWVAPMLEHLSRGNFDTRAFLEDPRFWNGRTALHQSVVEQHGEMLRYLLEQGLCDINCLCGDGKTALHVAALLKNPFCANILLKHGADRLARDRTRQIPFNIALILGSRSLKL